MRLVAPLDRAYHRPFHIGDGPSPSGSRLGGRSPALAAPPSLASSSQYVLTFPFVEDPLSYISVFINGPIDNLWEAMNQGLQPDDRIVAVRHGETGRGDSDRFRSEISAHPLLIGKEIEVDLMEDGEGGSLVSSGHKFGGRPYCIQEPELEGAEELLDCGYVHALQLDFPGSQDGAVEGSWPFADGLFNLFVKPQEEVLLYWAFQK